MHIVVLAGTRPEAVKVASIVQELRKRKCQVTLVSSGQHKEMIHQTFADFEISPDIDLQVMVPGQTLAGLSARLFTAVDKLLDELKPDWVIVQGDTTTVMVSALCAFYKGIKVGHVEAGLRSFCMHAPFPEELNRRIACLAATLHFAPTSTAHANLLREYVLDEHIVVTGNTVIDALFWVLKHGEASIKLIPEPVKIALEQHKKIILMTGHRRENLDGGFLQICQAILDIVKHYADVVFVYPVHLNPLVRDTVMTMLADNEQIILMDPVGYKKFVALMDCAYIVLTDSGGIQEEAPALGKPVLVMRDVTERPEGIVAGTSKLVGTNKDVIVKAISELLDSKEHYAKMAHASNPYGDGTAALKICDAIFAYKQ